jgi:hypothetical protein
MKTTRATVAAAGVAATLTLVAPAYAELGGAPTYTGTGSASASVSGAASQVTVRSQRQSQASVSYTVNTTTLAEGTVVREYVAPNGTVFAIAWEGPTMAPLNTLLGSYFPTYMAGLADNQATQKSFGPGAVRQAGLVVESGGHMRAFKGRAYLPQALPQGVSADDIQ